MIWNFQFPQPKRATSIRVDFKLLIQREKHILKGFASDCILLGLSNRQIRPILLEGSLPRFYYIDKQKTTVLLLLNTAGWSLIRRKRSFSVFFIWYIVYKAQNKDESGVTINWLKKRHDNDSDKFLFVFDTRLDFSVLLRPAKSKRKLSIHCLSFACLPPVAPRWMWRWQTFDSD